MLERMFAFPTHVYGELLLIAVVSIGGIVGTLLVFNKLDSKPAVLVGITALCLLALLQRLRPTYVHPQNLADDWARLFALLLAWPMLLGMEWPLCKIGDKLCNPKERSTYVRGAMKKDLFWFAVMVLAFGLWIGFNAKWPSALWN